MIRTQHPSNTRVLGAPSGWDQSALPCDALPVTDVVCDGHPGIASFWRPSPEELAALQAGAVVSLWVFGSVMPPVAVEVTRLDAPL